MKKFLLIVEIILLFAFITACGSNKIDTDITINDNGKKIVTKVKIDSIIYGDYFNFYVESGGKPRFSAEEWMSEEGKLLYPYEEKEEYMKGIDNIFASLYMPEEVVVKATSIELLKVINDGWFNTYATMPSLYNMPSHFAHYTIATNIAANELVQRSDMPEVLYSDYCTREYLKKDSKGDEKIFEATRIQFAEVVLGSNHAFSLMSDELKEKVLKEATKKNKQIISGEYHTDNVQSGFFSMIEEEYYNGGSLWYTYICDNEIDEVKEYIDVEYPDWR